MRLRNEIVRPEFSAWRRLYRYGDNHSFISITGFDKRTFAKLLELILVAPVGVKRDRRDTMTTLTSWD